MKKIVLTFAILLLLPFAAIAGPDKHIIFGQLPSASQKFIGEHFSDLQISLVTMDKELLDTTYEVIFTNGYKVEFGKNGEWKEMDCEFGQVPETALPVPISEFVARNHPGLHVIEIDRDKRDYELKLNNGIELKFDLKFKFLGYDN